MANNNGCMYCEQGVKLDELMISVCELTYTRVYLVKNQNYVGRCVVVYKNHVHEMFEISQEERNGYFFELSLVSKVINDMYGAAKMNYGIYGDNVPHLHCHVIPKQRDGYTWGSPFTLSGNDNYPPMEELQKSADAIRGAIEAAAK